MMITKQITRRQPLSNFSAPLIHPLINRIYANRGVNSVSEVDYKFDQLPRPDLLTGMGQACELLYEALSADANILIVGDYDVDGATSVVLVKQALESFGFNHVAYFIPDRLTFGYGLSPGVIDAVQNLQPDVIITVDNGISSYEGVKLAHEYGISVVITDHHLCAESLPQADAIINPNFPGDQFPCKSLAGVGVAFYLMLGLRRYLRKQKWFIDKTIPEPSMVEYLDLVALGTIADVVKLDFTNRLMVHQGMLRIKAGKCKQGIKALLSLSGCELQSVSTTDIAFKVAPKINAAGRLEDMSVGVECLLTGDSIKAELLAEKLNDINELRKSKQNKMNQQALELVDKQLRVRSIKKEKSAICLFSEDWHPGIVGLIASRLKDIFNRPSVIFACDQGKLKGSARSVAGVHIRDVLAEISSLYPKLIEKFGGHAMAAGLTIDKQSLSSFDQSWEAQIKKHLNGKDNTARIYTDGQLEADDLHIDTANLINESGPWGTGFEEPVFDNEFEVVNCKTMGKTGYHLRFTLKHPDDKGRVIIGVAFNANSYYDLRQLNMKLIHAAYRVAVNRYNSKNSLQIIIEYFVIK